jgi:hypothetical protein
VFVNELLEATKPSQEFEAGLPVSRVGCLIYGLRNRGHQCGRYEWPAAAIGRILNRSRSRTELDDLGIELKSRVRPAIECNPGADEKRLQLAEFAIIGLVIAQLDHPDAVFDLTAREQLLGRLGLEAGVAPLE